MELPSHDLSCSRAKLAIRISSIFEGHVIGRARRWLWNKSGPSALWMGHCYVRNVINHAPVITINSWYTHHSQMAGWFLLYQRVTTFVPWILCMSSSIRVSTSLLKKKVRLKDVVQWGSWNWWTHPIQRLDFSVQWNTAHSWQILGSTSVYFRDDPSQTPVIWNSTEMKWIAKKRYTYTQKKRSECDVAETTTLQTRVTGCEFLFPMSMLLFSGFTVTPAQMGTTCRRGDAWRNGGVKGALQTSWTSPFQESLFRSLAKSPNVFSFSNHLKRIDPAPIPAASQLSQVTSLQSPASMVHSAHSAWPIGRQGPRDPGIWWAWKNQKNLGPFLKPLIVAKPK